MNIIRHPYRTHGVVFLLFALCTFFSPLCAQRDTTEVSVDELFTIAREKAYNKQRTESRTLLRIALLKSPKYYDIRILLGRTYAWDGKYDSARIELKQVLAAVPSHQDAYNALIDVELWSDQNTQALAAVNHALQYYPSDEEFLLKKARALKNLGRDREALNVLNTLEDIHPSAPGIEPMRQVIVTKTLFNSIGINYAVDAFPESAPMHYFSLQYNRRTQFGSFFTRLNDSYRFEETGAQLEFDFYPRITDGTYAYLNYGFSNGPLFPKHRFGGEFYSNLPASFEGSLGFRFLYFGPGSSVTIYTGTIGYYYGSFWFCFRPYFTPGDAATSKSASLTLRYFFGDIEEYVSFRMGAGFTPDERFLQASSGIDSKEVYYLDSQTFGIGLQMTAGLHYLLTASFDYTHQEKSYDPGSYLKMYSLSAGWKVKF